MRKECVLQCVSTAQRQDIEQSRPIYDTFRFEWHCALLRMDASNNNISNRRCTKVVQTKRVEIARLGTIRFNCCSTIDGCSVGCRTHCLHRLHAMRTKMSSRTGCGQESTRAVDPLLFDPSSCWRVDAFLGPVVGVADTTKHRIGRT